jgi:hypothetical protein
MTLEEKRVVQAYRLEQAQIALDDAEFLLSNNRPA